MNRKKGLGFFSLIPTYTTHIEICRPGQSSQLIEVAKEVALRNNTVIACGGGVVLNNINIDRLKQESVIVLLTASPDVILKRTSNDKNERPLLTTSDKARKISELIGFRQPFYERAAEFIIDTSDINISTVIEQIVSNLKHNESFSFKKPDKREN